MSDTGNRQEGNVTRREQKEGDVTGGKAEMRAEAQAVVEPERGKSPQDRSAIKATAKKKAVTKKRTVAKKKAVPKKKVSAKKKTVRKRASRAKKAGTRHDASQGELRAADQVKHIAAPMQGNEPPAEATNKTDKPKAATPPAGAGDNAQADTLRAAGARTAEGADKKAEPATAAEDSPKNERPQQKAGTKSTPRAAAAGSRAERYGDAEIKAADDASSAWDKQEPAPSIPPPKSTKRTNYWPWAAFLMVVVISVFLLNGRRTDTGSDSQSPTAASATTNEKVVMQGPEAQDLGASTAQVAAQPTAPDDAPQPVVEARLVGANALEGLPSVKIVPPLAPDGAVEMQETDVAAETELSATAVAQRTAGAGGGKDATDEIVTTAGVTEQVATEATDTGAGQSESGANAVISTPAGLDDERVAASATEPDSAQLAVTEDTTSLSGESLGAGSAEDLQGDKAEVSAEVATVETSAKTGVELSSFSDALGSESVPGAELADTQQRIRELAADESDPSVTTSQETSGDSAKASPPSSQHERLPAAAAVTARSVPTYPPPLTLYRPQPPVPRAYPYGGYRPAPYIGAWPPGYFGAPPPGPRQRSE